MNKEQYTEHFYKEKQRVHDLHMSSQVERDRVILSLSTFALTILAGFGMEILSLNKMLAVSVIVLFIITIALQMIGFYLTSKNALAISENMDNNVKAGRRFFDPDYVKTEWSMLIKALNALSMISFILGLVCLSVIMIIGVIGP